MQISLRSAYQEDAERIADIYLSARKRFIAYAPLVHNDQEIRNWVRQSLIPSNGVTVAVADNSILGFLAISKSAEYSWIDHLYLDPSAVGSGFGSRLLNLAKIQAPPPIRLYTFQQNVGARKFYHRHGFREIQLTDGATNEEKIPEVLMEWP